MDDLKTFKNVNYPYKDQDDTFFARGLHLNMLRNWVISLFNGISISAPWNEGLSIVLGRSENIDGAEIDYNGVFPGSPGIGGQYDQVGELSINNSMEHASNQRLSFTRESVNHGGGTSTNIDIDIVKSGDNLVMIVTNNTGYDMDFSYTLKILKT